MNTNNKGVFEQYIDNACKINKFSIHTIHINPNDPPGLNQAQSGPN